MSEPHTPWKDLEGQRLRIDVGSTSAEALASTENSTIYFTTDGYVIMNGCIFAGPPSIRYDNETCKMEVCLSPEIGTEDSIPVSNYVCAGLVPAGFISEVKKHSDWGVKKVNVCKAIPTRPRKGQIYYFPGRPHMVLRKERFKEGDSLPATLFHSYRLVLKDETTLEDVSTKWVPAEDITEDISLANWETYFGAAEQVEGMLELNVPKGTPALIEILEDGFFAEEKIEVTEALCPYVGQVVPSSPNFEFFHHGSVDRKVSLLKVRCIKEPPLKVWNRSKALAYFNAKGPRRHLIFGVIDRKIKEYERIEEEGQWVRKKNIMSVRCGFFAVSSIHRGKVSVKKAFVRSIDIEWTRFKTYEFR